MSTKIGCDNLVFVPMTTEDTATAAPVYGTVVRAPGVMSLNINPNGAQETLFADDGPMDTASTLGKIEVEIQKNELTTAEKAALLGHTIDAKGGLVYGASDIAPWVAIGFRTLKSNGKYRYVWLYKGKFTEPEDANETKGDSINFQNDTISGQFTRLTYEHTVTVGSGSSAVTTKMRAWKYEMDADHSGADETTMSTWFSAPVMPSSST